MLLAAKAQLRNGGPVLVAVSTNDALAANAKNLGLLLNTRNVLFRTVPAGRQPEEVHVDRGRHEHDRGGGAACAGRETDPAGDARSRSNG